MQNIEALRNRRTVTAERLEHLRSKLGGAVLDGDKPDKLHADIDRAAADLDGLMLAEAEAVRRERSEQAEEAQRKLYRNRSEMESALERYLTATDTAMQSTLNLCASLRDARFAAAELQRLSVAIGGKTNAELQPSQADAKLSNLIGEVLSGVTGRPSFGVLKFTPLPKLSPRKVTDWREHEDKRLRSAVEQFVKG
jgi:hypothetical protein